MNEEMKGRKKKKKIDEKVLPQKVFLLMEKPFEEEAIEVYILLK